MHVIDVWFRWAELRRHPQSILCINYGMVVAIQSQHRLALHMENHRGKQLQCHVLGNDMK